MKGTLGKRSCQHSRGWKSLTNHTLYSRWQMLSYFSEVFEMHEKFTGVDSVGKIAQGSINCEILFPLGPMARHIFKRFGDFLKYFWKCKEPKSWISSYQSKRELHQTGTSSHLSYCRWWWQSEARWKRLLVITPLLQPRLQPDLPVNDRDCSSLHTIKCLKLPPFKLNPDKASPCTTLLHAA